eukprot:CAMPEP_0174263968 /NCGR_PEP_ID=MMETSP0439-20130205/20796_1 /TAXON_ID=0 /ORGANISM="Stereomyxa ramosa, Strain Chinc5" /LENGTH=429 /DNA_ID=CAMNT_0015349621 /DNA_START=355 /DNA_END=1644 /DNA_ORIENTATION=-
MDTNEVEARLNAMLGETLEAALVGENTLAQAREAVLECEKTAQQIEAAHERLELISSELEKQNQLLTQLITQLSVRAEGLERVVQKFKTGEKEVTTSLHNILETLKLKRLHPKLNDNQTLYDFVDSESVEGLMEQASKEIEEMEKIQSWALKIIGEFEVSFNKLSEAAKKANVRVDLRLIYPSEKASLQINETNAMASNVLSIASQADRLRFVIKNLPDSIQFLDIEALQQKTEELPRGLQVIQNRLERVQSTSRDMRERSIKYAKAFTNAKIVYKNLHQFGEKAKTCLKQLDDLEEQFESKRECACSLFEELSNLATWYDLFNTAYEELLIEIRRRHLEEKRHAKIVQMYQHELDLLFTMEAQKRDNFYEFYGRYLPQSLCPAIMENPVKYDIAASRQGSRLPVLDDPVKSEANTPKLERKNSSLRIS